MNLDLARFQLDFLAFTRHLVSTASMHLNGRVGRRGLLDLSDETLKYLLELRFSHIQRGVILACETSFGIKGISGTAQTQDGLVALVRGRNKFTQAYCRTNQHNQY